MSKTTFLKPSIYFIFLLGLVSNLLVLNSCNKDDETIDVNYSISYLDTNIDLQDVAFFQGSYVLVGGRSWEIGVLIKSKDFVEFTIDSISYNAMLDLFTYGDDIYCTGVDGRITVVNNGQIRYQNYLGKVEEDWSYTVLRSIYVDDNRIIITGGKSYNNGQITQLNKEYKLIEYDTFVNQLNEIESLGDGRLMAVGYGQVLSYDEGENKWKQENVFGDNFIACSFDYHSSFWVAGADGSIIRLNTETQRWEKLRDESTFFSHSQGLNDILFIDENNGIVVGQEGYVSITTNAGKTWSQANIKTDNNLNKVIYAENQYLIIGDDGIVIKIDLP
ncbi:MAG TPA: YCF48-related protein [Saprospiraceae bacterium]|nr:hypothetical protein [Lewinellaceae bacterium]HRX29089.1 YCF48-related protein [Saprospiraceae bacterium]